VGNRVSRGSRCPEVGVSGGDGSTIERSTHVRNTIRKRPLVAVVAAVIAVAAVSVVAASGASGTSEASFDLTANPKFVNCLAKYRTILPVLPGQASTSRRAI
jgi:hypothetical protein